MNDNDSSKRSEQLSLRITESQKTAWTALEDVYGGREPFINAVINRMQRDAEQSSIPMADADAVERFRKTFATAIKMYETALAERRQAADNAMDAANNRILAARSERDAAQARLEQAQAKITELESQLEQELEKTKQLEEQLAATKEQVASNGQLIDLIKQLGISGVVE